MLLQNLYQLTLPPHFEPADSERQFSFAMVESAYETLLPSYISPLLEQAPRLNLNSYGWTEGSMQALLQGQIDFGITARDLHPTSDFRLNNLPHEIVFTTLFTDEQTCLVRKNHPVLKKAEAGLWNREEYLAMAHLQVRCEGNDWWALDYHLAELGKQRKISATLPDFYGAASVCAHSNLIFTLPSNFVEHAKKLYSLVQLPLPIEFSPIAYVLLWHRRNNDEPGHKWIRETICENVSKVMSISN